MRRLLTLLFVLPALAGCLGDGGSDVQTDSTPDPVAGTYTQTEVEDYLETRQGGDAWTPLAIVGDVDTGINPYHMEFRDDSVRAFIHPSEYIPGYPADVPALELSLGIDDYETAVRADCAVWSNVTQGQLYWVPGTRIVGAITFADVDEELLACDDENLPGAILDRGGHGTMTTSRAAGDQSSLCPMCLIVHAQGFSDTSMVWLSNQPWIDGQTNSWGDLPTSVAEPVLGGFVGNDRSEIVAAGGRHAIFVAGGNGLAGFFGVTGHPAYFDNVAGPGKIIMVGGHDNGYYTPWTMTLPHVVADANEHPSALYNQVHNRSETGGGGTSGATPFVAGTFMRGIYETRLAMNDTGVGVRDGNIVVAGEGVTLPAEGPLADGLLTLEEAERVLMRTANPRPVEDGYWDGPACEPPNCGNLYLTAPLEWALVPEDLPMYYYVGYGQVGEVTLQHFIDVLLGAAPEPDRSVEDEFFMADTAAREAFDMTQSL